MARNYLNTLVYRQRISKTIPPKDTVFVGPQNSFINLIFQLVAVDYWVNSIKTKRNRISSPLKRKKS